jgi:hypothetical protein
MVLILALALCQAVPTRAISAPGANDDTLAVRIESLLNTILTTTDEKEEAAAKAEALEIFERTGLPRVSEVGEKAAYDFVFLLVGTGELEPGLQARVLEQTKKAAARSELPADAAVFCEAHLRLEKAKEVAAAHTPSNPELRDEIEKLAKSDQAVRQQEGFELKKMEAMDKQNAAPLLAIFQRYGVPTYDMVGPQAAADFVIMVQHHSAELRKAILPGLKANVDAGQADPDSYALVYDRSRRDQGQKQLYGTQLECGADRQLHEAPIEDEAHVNLRRAELGLMRMELYARLVKESSPPVCQPPATRP